MPFITIHSVRLFDGQSVHDKASVTFDTATGLITEVSTGTPTSTVSGESIDGTGQTLIPGLIEAHVHAHGEHLLDHASTANASPEDFRAIMHSAIKCGVTTICDMFSDSEAVERYRSWLTEEKTGSATTVIPDLKTSVYGATVDGGWPKPVVLGRDPKPEVVARVSKWPNLTIPDVPAYVATQKAAGADYIKLFQEDGCSLSFPQEIPAATPALQKAIVHHAHAAGLMCVGHALSLDNTTTLLEAGVDGLTHTFIDQPLTPALLALYKRTNAFVIPTLVILASLTGERQDLRDRFAHTAASGTFVSEPVAAFLRMAMNAKSPHAELRHALDTIRTFRREGVDVLAGTDSAAGLPGTAVGPALWMEMDLYARECGFSAVEALRSATGVSARRFGFGDRGLVEKGRRADLVLMKGDVTADVGVWGEGVVGVWKGGVRAV